MGRLARIAVPAAVIAAIVGGMLGGITDAAARNGSAQQEYVGTDGCSYFWNGSANTGRRCRQSDGSDYYFRPDGRGGWDFYVECASVGDYGACLFEFGLYVETYGDGSRYLEDRNRNYEIYRPDGALAESGHYDDNGVQVATWWPVTVSRSQAMHRRSDHFWRTYGTTMRLVRLSNPTYFDSVVAGTAGANVYANCLWANDSATDFDGDRRTGFNELAEYCAS